jgi:putative ABC transport system permease protein
LLNTYQYNDNREYTSIKPFKDDVTQISLINAANEKNTFTIGGILEQADLKEYGFWELTPYPVRIVVPDADARSCDWFSMPSDEDDYTEYARSVMDEYFPIAAEDSYVEQGYTVRIARTDAMVKMLNIAIVLVEIVMYGFVILLVLMGFTSVISTLTTNIRIRSREFAVLKSVGMTKIRAFGSIVLSLQTILPILPKNVSALSCGHSELTSLTLPNGCPQTNESLLPSAMIYA